MRQRSGGERHVNDLPLIIHISVLEEGFIVETQKPVGDRYYTTTECVRRACLSPENVIAMVSEALAESRAEPEEKEEG